MMVVLVVESRNTHVHVYFAKDVNIDLPCRILDLEKVKEK